MQLLDTAVAKSTNLPSPWFGHEPRTTTTMAKNSETSPLQNHVCSSSDDKLQCNECFGTWLRRRQRNGAEWVQCSYCQWIHTDFIGGSTVVTR